MSEANKPFVVNDRRKFTMDGELRPDTESSRPHETRAAQETSSVPAQPPVVSEAPPQPTAPAVGEVGQDLQSDMLPELKAPTPEQMEQSRVAYEATADRLDTAIRAANPGRDQPPKMSLEQLVQSVYMTAIMQLGGTSPDDQQPQLDLLGARQSIEMLTMLYDKSKGNLTSQEHRLLEGALFDARLAFLEVTQALVRSAAAANPAPNRPSIVR